MSDPPVASAKDLLAEARDELKHADQKASILLAALGVGTAAFLGALVGGDLKPREFDGWTLVVYWGGAAFALAAVFAAACAVWPRTTHAHPTGPITFWGHVADFSQLDTFRGYLAAHAATDENRTTDQLWHVARILRRKYRWVRVALVAAGLAIACFVIVAISTS